MPGSPRSPGRRFGPLAAALALVLGLAGSALASTGERIEPSEPAPWDLDSVSADGFVEDLWFVELGSAPEARGGSAAAHAQDRNRFRAEAQAEGVEIEERESFSTLWNGLTVRGASSEMQKVRQLSSVTAVYPVAIIEAPEPDDVDPTLSTALSMTGADIAQSELGHSGEGLKVAIIDTGIDYNHPDLGGAGDPDNVIDANPDRTMNHPRVTHGWDYAGDEYNPADPAAPPEPDPNPNPMDVVGHGTHVAGIVGASSDGDEGVTGVAPDVTFGAYKVFGPGSTSADVIVEALEDAYTDGMDIVNMSLGAAFFWGQDYPTAAASNELVANGVVVVNSAGNSGAAGPWSLGSPGNAHDAIGVASADNTFFDARTFEVEQFDDVIPFSTMSGAEAPPEEGSDEVAWLGRACVDSEDDELLDDPDGRIALIVRGDCTFSEKYLAAANAGATGVVIYNNVSGQFAGTIGDDGIEGVWAVGIGNSDGEALVDLIEDGETVELEYTDVTATLPNPTGGLVSSFSSYGLDPELEFKPSIMAPGGLITSTYPLALGEYATISGTSMSAPHVSGTVALLLEAEPDLDPIAVRHRLQNTAEPSVWSLNPALGLLDHTFRQGAGMVQIDRAILAEQHAAPGQLALGDGADDIDAAFTVTNTGDAEVTYTLGYEAALEIGFSTFNPGFLLHNYPVVFAEPTITLGSGESAEVELTVTPPAVGIPNHQYGGYITLTPDDDTATALRVPYAGFAGDYLDRPLLGWQADDGSQVDVDPRVSEIIRDEDGFIDDFDPVEPGHQFNVGEGDYPVVQAFFGHFPREMEVWAVHQRTGQRHLAIHAEYLPRSPAMDEYRSYLWDGRVQAGNSGNTRPAPQGTYTFEMRVLRTAGDADNPDHWETWESEPFEITRSGDPGGPPGGGPPGLR
jgi:minor extracellular serine protease Vpr